VPAFVADLAVVGATASPAVFVVVLVVPAALLAAGLVVAFVATAIVSSPLSETSAYRLASALPVRAGASLPLPLPAGVLRIPSFVAFSYPIERVLGFVPRVVRTQPVRRAADVVTRLHAVMRKAPVVPVSTAAAHDITVHRKARIRHRFA